MHQAADRQLLLLESFKVRKVRSNLNLTFDFERITFSKEAAAQEHLSASQTGQSLGYKALGVHLL